MEAGELTRKDPAEERGCRDTEPCKGKMEETLGSDPISTKLERIAKLAREAPDMVLTTLAHHIDLDWLKRAYRRVRKDGAAGVDGQTASEYAANLEDNLRSLLERAKSGTYFAPPVRRVHIPKGTKPETRPIGIPTFEDKILQRAVVMVLEAVYEQDFLDCSYGFRPGRSPRRAIEALQHDLMCIGGGWVLDVDIRKFFDTLDHKHLREILCHRVRDGVLLRLIGKWLNAGVMEAGELSYPEDGTPQGGVISPLLANIYLHEVLDVWFERDVRPRLMDRASLVRYADDFVMAFGSEQDARRVMEVLPKRLAKYGLEIHPEKTRLVYFQRPDRRPPNGGAGPRPETFDLLGFTHYWGQSRKGKWVVKWKTASDRFVRSLKRVATWCQHNRHLPVREQWRSLVRKLTGHYNYFGVMHNSWALHRFRFGVKWTWRKWLGRRSQHSYLSWKKLDRLLAYLPLPTPGSIYSRVT